MKVLAEYATGRITETEATKRLAFIKGGFSVDVDKLIELRPERQAPFTVLPKEVRDMKLRMLDLPTGLEPKGWEESVIDRHQEQPDPVEATEVLKARLAEIPDAE